MLDRIHMFRRMVRHLDELTVHHRIRDVLDSNPYSTLADNQSLSIEVSKRPVTCASR